MKPSDIEQIEYPIQVSGLSRQFSQTFALNNVDLAVPRGSVFGLVGENGAGKTTLVKHLIGLYKAQRGSVRVFGLDPVKEVEAVLGNVGYLSEDRDLPNWMTVSELIWYVQSFYPDWDATYAEELRESFELDPTMKIKHLSRGRRALAGLLVALAHHPSLLVLDEPSSGLDPVVRRDILTAVIRTVADAGRTVLFSSHLLDEVERVADNVAMVHKGQVVLSAPINDLKGRHCRLTLHFPEPQRTAPALPGALFWEGEGREWTAICDGEAEVLRAAVQSTQAQIVEEGIPSLEDIFVARVRAGRRMKTEE